jgi:hypothetical protein
MIRTSTKPLSGIIPRPKLERLPERMPRYMTLVNAFRTRSGGILLCADREENDGWTKRAVHKLYQIHYKELLTCEWFITGAGPAGEIIDACIEIDRAVQEAIREGKDVLKQHREIIETSLKTVYERHDATLQSEPMGLIVVIAPYAPNSIPLLYKSKEAVLIPIGDENYVAWGTGKALSDYFASCLYRWDRLDKQSLAALAAFILREAGSAAGVGLRAEMVFIHDTDSCTLHWIYADKVAELQAGIPSLEDAIWAYWKEHAKVPSWINTDISIG